MKALALLAALAVLVPTVVALSLRPGRFRGLFLAIIFAAPSLGVRASLNFWSMETYRGPDRGFEVTLADLVALGLAIAMILGRRERPLRWLPYNSLACLGFFVAALASAAVAPSKLYAAFTLWKMVRLYIVYWAVVNTVRGGVPAWSAWAGLATAGAVVTFSAVQQKYLWGFYRVKATFDHSNTIPLFLNQAMPALLAWGLGDVTMSPTRALLSVGIALGMVFSVVATMSRAGILLAGLSLLVTVTLALRRERRRLTEVTAMLVLLAMVAGGIKAASSIMDRVKNAPEESGQARDEFNLAADLMLRDHPVIGVGINNFPEVLTNEDKYNGHIQVMANEEQAGVCHHIYRLTLAETGYVGFALFLLVILRFLWRAGRLAFRGHGLHSLLGAGFLFGHLALHGSGFLEWAFRITPVAMMYASTCGLLVALSDDDAEAMRPPGPSPPGA